MLDIMLASVKGNPLTSFLLLRPMSISRSWFLCMIQFQYDDEENASCFNYQFNGASKTCFTSVPVFFLTLFPSCFFPH